MKITCNLTNQKKPMLKSGLSFPSVTVFENYVLSLGKCMSYIKQKEDKNLC